MSRQAKHRTYIPVQAVRVSDPVDAQAVSSVERLEAFKSEVRTYAKLRREFQSLTHHIADQGHGPIADEDREELIVLSRQLFEAESILPAQAMILLGNGVIDRAIDLITLENEGVI